MKLPKMVYACQQCGAQHSKWMGRCPDCGAWNSIVEERPEPASLDAPPGRFALPSSGGMARLIDEVDTASAASQPAVQPLGAGAKPDGGG